MAEERLRTSQAAGRPAPAREFDVWATESGPALLRFAHVITGNDHDAADAVQDALIAVFSRWRRLVNSEAHDAYARRVIVNRTISRWRRFGRREHLTSTDESNSPISPDHASGTSDAMVARSLLGSLPRQQRAAVSLRFYDDLAFTQIADILGCTESTARGYVHRALSRLREQLASTEWSPTSEES